MPTTEIVVFPLTPETDIGDPTNAAAAALRDSLAAVSRQDGCQQTLFGKQIETPQSIEVIVRWDSISKHHDFMAGPEYQAVQHSLKDFIAGKVQMWHVDFKPEGAESKVFAAPVTEVATFYFDGAPASDYLGNALEFGDRVAKGGVDGFVGAVVGTTHEKIESDGVKGMGAVIAIGWQSVEAHMEFRASELFKEIIGLLRSDAKKIEMHHTTFMRFLE